MGDVVKHFGSLAQAAKAIERDARSRDRRVRGAVAKTARAVRTYVVGHTVPKAFKELAGSIHVWLGARGNAAVIADAPHAEAVEKGSRPHTPPLAPLIAWVALRGVQGLTEQGRVKSNRTRQGRVGDYRKEAARAVASALVSAMPSRNRAKYGVVGQAGQWRQRAAHHLASGNRAALAADPATVAAARAIQQGIRKHGTKPQPYMRAAIPEAEERLDEYVREALEDTKADAAAEAYGQRVTPL